MKTYTFKIKYREDIGLTDSGETIKADFPTVVICIHCPIEVFFDSVKATKELVSTFKTILKDKPDSEIYVTISDYVDSDGVYIDKEYTLCHISAILESKDLKEFFTHENCYGVI